MFLAVCPLTSESDRIGASQWADVVCQKRLWADAANCAATRSPVGAGDTHPASKLWASLASAGRRRPI